MRVPQRVERNAKAKLAGDIAPRDAERSGMPRPLGARKRKYERVVRRLTEPELDPHLQLLASMIVQRLDDDVGKRNRAFTALGLRFLEADAILFTVLERGTHSDD